MSLDGFGKALEGIRNMKGVSRDDLSLMCAAIEQMAKIPEEGMSSNPRDTQFTGFAELLVDSLPWKDLWIEAEAEGWEERWKTVAAQCLYDFACHVSMHTILSAHGDMNKIPDMTEWPEREENGQANT